MKIARLAGLLVVACLALALLPVVSASAAEPLFSPVSGQSITGTSGVSILTAVTGQSITCLKDTASGAVSSSLLAGKVFVHYLECTSKESAEPACTVKSIGAPEEGLIITKELHGILGIILPSGATGILFLPTSGKIFVELEKANGGTGTQKCTPVTKVTGTVAGEVTPTAKKQLTGKIIFPLPVITKIDLTHGLGLREPELVAFTGAASLMQEESVTFGEPTEVT